MIHQKAVVSFSSLLAAFCILVSALPAKAAIPEAERNALIDLYNSTSGGSDCLDSFPKELSVILHS
jgi:hypothetical protein